jgi:hypothetical protein
MNCNLIKPGLFQVVHVRVQGHRQLIPVRVCGGSGVLGAMRPCRLRSRACHPWLHDLVHQYRRALSKVWYLTCHII